MDKVKIALAILKKQHFWVLCGVVLVVGLACWWVATGSLDSETTARTAQIQGSFSAMSNIIGQPDHPNGEVITGINDTTDRVSKEVFETWRQLYLDQKEKNQLPEILTPGFKDAFNNPNPDYVIDRRYREEYMNFIDQHIPKLFEIGDILRPASGLRPIGEGVVTRSPLGGGFQDDPTEEEELLGVVEWLQTDQDRVRQSFEWQATPSTLRVRLAQEDLWVYETLFRIIKNTNGPVRIPQDAAIKQIVALQIAQDAAKTWQEGIGDFMADGSTADPNAAYASAPSDTMAGTGVVSDDLLADRRYVDAEGQPLAADQAHPFAEFKLMPIYLQLVMDQRKLTKLLTECANSSMPIEVRKVTYTGATANATTRYSDRGTVADRQGPSYLEPRATEGSIALEGVNVQVEIQGTICIYNPPDESKLGTGAAAEAPVEPDAPAEPTEPATAGTPADAALAGGP